MSFQVYNSLTRQKEPFETIEEGKVRMYNCGPTVYNRQHIGNFRAFLFADTLRRWLEYLGYDVRQVMNITDVGHMTDDQDDGDDKVEAQAQRENRKPEEISSENALVFLQDLALLGVRPAHEYPYATGHVPQMLAIIEDLIEKGNAYQVGGDVYFDVSSFPAYGRLSGNKVEDLEAGARIEVRQEKRHPADFALWKSDPHHLMKWPSRFGPDGFPGWHIECTAMAIQHLGEELDIHTGGEDNVFPHHECEIAQSESYTGKRFARYWMHTKFLQVDGGKMSKSLGNVYTLDDVREYAREHDIEKPGEEGFALRALRYALIRGHYRQPLSFTWDILQESASALRTLDDLVARLRRAAGDLGDAAASGDSSLLAEVRGEFERGLNDDLNMPVALAALFALRNRIVSDEPRPAEAAALLDFVLRSNDVLGVVQTQEQRVEEDAEALCRQRDQARAEKDWAEADRIRGVLEARGYSVEDTAEGTRLSR